MKTKLLKRISLFVLLNCLFLHSSLYSQSKQSWDSKVSFGGSYYTGNVNKFDLRSIGNVTRNDSTMEYSVFYKVIFGCNKILKINGIDTLKVWIDNNKEFSCGGKTDYLPYNTISPFLMVEGYKNEPKKIDWRISGLAGAKWSAFRSETGQYSLSAAAIYQLEKYLISTVGTQSPKKESARLSFRPKIKQKIGKNLTFDHLTFLKFTLNDFNDYNIESTTTLATRLSNQISLDFSFDLQYDNKVPDVNIEKTDQAFVVSITIKL
jgi:hypothetical protein